MKKKGYLTRFLIMCLIVIFSLAGNPSVLAANAATGGQYYRLIFDDTKTYVSRSKTSPSDTATKTYIPTGSNFNLNYGIGTTFGATYTDLSDLENVLIVVAGFSSNEKNTAASAKKSRFTREVLKGMVGLIQKAKNGNPCKIGFLKVGDNTVFSPFKELNVDYMSDTVKYNDGSAKQEQYSDSRMDFYNNTLEQSKMGNGTITPNINVDIGNMFTETKNIVAQDYKKTLEDIKAATDPSSKTKVYFIMDGSSADDFYSKLGSSSNGTVNITDLHNNAGSDYPSRDHTILNTSTNTVPIGNPPTGLETIKYDKEAVRITDNNNPSIKYNMETDFVKTSTMSNIEFMSNFINLNNVSKTCLYINKDADLEHYKNYYAKINYDSTFKYKDDGNANFDSKPTGNIVDPMGFYPLGCTETNGVIGYDPNNLLGFMVGSIKDTEVKLYQDLPQNITVVDDNGLKWKRTATDLSGREILTSQRANTATAVSDSVYEVGTKLDNNFNYQQGYSEIAPPITLKCSTPGKYTLKYKMVYTLPDGHTQETVTGEFEIYVKTDMLASFTDNSSIVSKKDVQRGVGIKLDTLGAAATSVNIVLGTQNTSQKVIITPQLYTSGGNYSYSYSVDASGNYVITVDASPSGGFKDVGTLILQIKPTYTSDPIDPSKPEYVKDVMEIKSVDFVSDGVSSSTLIAGNVSPALNTIIKTKPITVYNKIKIR